MELAAAPEPSTQVVTSKSAIDESAEQAKRAESLAAPPLSPTRDLLSPFPDSTGTPLDEIVTGAAAARDGVSEGDVSRGINIPVRELEIALGMLVALLLAATYWVARRGVGKP